MSDGSETNDFTFRVHGETASRNVVGRGEEIGTYLKRIWGLRAEDLGEEPRLGEHVDCHRDGSAIGSFKKGLEALLKSVGVMKSPEDVCRTAYSLRLTYARRRSEEGVHPYLLAKKTGPSVLMLQNFYGHATNRTNVEELTKTRLGSTRDGD